MKYPVLFHAKSHSISGIQKTWITESLDFKTQCAIPPEFEGPGGAVSPEDLFAQALTNCFVATFKVYAEKSKIYFSQIEVKTELTVDLDENKKPVMKTGLLSVSISGCENPDRVRTIADKVLSSGFILNSVKTQLRMELQILS